MGYLICDKCGGYYELQPGESPDDFEMCECGGKLRVEVAKPRKVNSTEVKGEKEKNKLINCPDCGHEVSKSAATCPNCGKDLKTEGLGKDTKCCLVFVLIFIIVMVLWGLVNFLYKMQ